MLSPKVCPKGVLDVISQIWLICANLVARVLCVWESVRLDYSKWNVRKWIALSWRHEQKRYERFCWWADRCRRIPTRRWLLRFLANCSVSFLFCVVLWSGCSLHSRHDSVINNNNNNNSSRSHWRLPIVALILMPFGCYIGTVYRESYKMQFLANFVNSFITRAVTDLLRWHGQRVITTRTHIHTHWRFVFFVVWFL